MVKGVSKVVEVHGERMKAGDDTHSQKKHVDSFAGETVEGFPLPG